MAKRELVAKYNNGGRKMYRITITMATNIAMSHREQKQLREELDAKGYETIRIEQKEVKPITPGIVH